MNTRLQVEHPVTEEVTGLDLVRAQLIVASGDPLPWLTPPTQRGHAIEARVYAEDPEHGFLPQAGRVRLYREPRAPGVRIDSGLAEGAEVPVHYDPLLAKVIASAETRELARARLTAALRDFPILGIRTNVPFLLRILEDARFRSGDVDTTFLDSSMESGGSSLADTAPVDPPDFVLAAMAAVDDQADIRSQDVEPRRAWDPWQAGTTDPPPFPVSATTSVPEPRPRDGWHPSHGSRPACSPSTSVGGGKSSMWPDHQTIAGHSGTATSSIRIRRSSGRSSPKGSGASRSRSRCRRRCRRR